MREIYHCLNPSGLIIPCHILDCLNIINLSIINIHSNVVPRTWLNALKIKLILLLFCSWSYILKSYLLAIMVLIHSVCSYGFWPFMFIEMSFIRLESNCVHIFISNWTHRKFVFLYLEQVVNHMSVLQRNI